MAAFTGNGRQVSVECAAWRTQPIEGAYAYVYLDGIVLKRSWGGEVRRSNKIGLISRS